MIAKAGQVHWRSVQVVIADRIGSYPKHVESHYIAYQIVRQAEPKGVPGHPRIKFGVLMRALQTPGIQEFLGVTYPNDPKKSQVPVPRKKMAALSDFIAWAFGTDETTAVLGDSWNLSKFGQILSSSQAVRYLRTAPAPRFDRAWQKSGGEQESLLDSLWTAADMLEEAVPAAPSYSSDPEVNAALDKCVKLTGLLLRDFESIRTKYSELLCDDRTSEERG